MITNVMPRPADAPTRREPVPAKHMLPPLPYDYAALEPSIDARTMMLHHDKHHASYVEKLNAALENFPELRGRSASWLLLNLIKVPKEIRTAVRHNAGGHVKVLKDRDLRIHAGVGSNQSPVGASDNVFNKVDLLTWTLGASGSIAKFQFSAGFNHQSGHANDVTLRNLLNGDVVRSTIDVGMTGFIYSLAYKF